MPDIVLMFAVSCGRLGDVARKGGTFGPCSLLLRKPLYEVVWQYQRQ